MAFDYELPATSMIIAKEEMHGCEAGTGGTNTFPTTLDERMSTPKRDSEPGDVRYAET